LGKYVITGGFRLEGSIRINGAKNACLPVLAATVLNKGISEIYDVTYLKDVEVMLEILNFLGAVVEREGYYIRIDTSNLSPKEIPEELMRKMRSSIFLMGPLITRFGKVRLSYPGGCDLGPRPIDLHLKGLRMMGANLTEEHGFIEAHCDKLKGCNIHLDFPSVGATENLMMAAALAQGVTVIRNAAKEPEIVDLQNFINNMGGSVTGAGTDTIKVVGVEKLNSVKHTVIPDRIVAGTYMVAAAITGGQVKLKNIILEHVEPIIAKLRESGCVIETNGDSLTVNGPKQIQSIDIIRTLPHPGFPTDMQAPIMALMSIANGTTMLTETIFENRFKHVDELRRMGADIKINGRAAVIKGVKSLTGAAVEAKDLRAGAALVIAGLAAEGTTIVDGAQHIERGYENIDKNLTSLGAHIKKID
jgi:UDP-N-acetylglucosamine 1-carboxyvinyltransferase